MLHVPRITAHCRAALLYSSRQGVQNHVRTHFESGLTLGGRIAVHGFILPAVAEVGLIIIIADHDAVQEHAEALRGQFIVLVNLGRAVGKIVLRVIDGMMERQFDELRFGQDLFQFAAEARVHAVVVVGEQESARREVGAERAHVILAERHVAVAVDEDNRMREQFQRGRFHGHRFGGEADVGVVAHEGNQVVQGPRRAVPIAAALVFEQADFGLTAGSGGLSVGRTIYKDSEGARRPSQPS